MSENKKEEFAQKMTNILNYGALNLAMGIGYKAGLFDTMAEMAHPGTIKEISNKANLNERYVAEWLGIMATGEIVDIVPEESDEDKYFLPLEHSVYLTTKSGDLNLGVYTQEIPLLTHCALKEIEKNFSSGNGVPFSIYPEFQSFMAELSNAKHEKILLQKFLPSVDNGKLLPLLSQGIKVCDLGCGEGVALNLMAAHFPESNFVGIDNHDKAIETARAAAEEKQLGNVKYLLQDSAEIFENPEFENQFEYIMAFDSIHDQTRPLKALQGIWHMLSRDGIFSMVDIDSESNVKQNLNHPMGPFLYTVSLMHCMPVGLVDNGAGLGMMWGRKKAVYFLEKAGFETIDVCEMEYDPFNVHYFCRK